MTKDDSGADPPAGAGMITFTGPLHVYGDPCKWSTTKPETPAKTVDELVAALSARRRATPRRRWTSRWAAMRGSPSRSTCRTTRCSAMRQRLLRLLGRRAEPTPYRYHQGPGQIDEVWILDVGGVLTVIDTAYYAGTPVEHVEEMRAIVESTTFE